MKKSERLNAIKNHLKITKNTDFAKFLGVKPTTLSMWYKRDTFDIELIFKKCEFISPEWLLTGQGSMLKTDEKAPVAVKIALPSDDIAPVPLVEPTAVAGFGSHSFAIAEQDVKEYYVIPKFRHRKVDFMIEVHGNSMYPKYNSGDIVAVTIINESGFIQWNKPHVVATKSQGILVKRLLKGSLPDTLTLKSDNKDYPPFEVPKDEITGIGLIVGVIRLE